MATTQKVVAVLRKAGLEIATFNKSGQIRGWGTFSRGYKARKRGEVIRVDWEDGPYAFRMDDGLRRAAYAKAVDKARDVLLAAGLKVAIERTDTYFWLEVEA